MIAAFFVHREQKFAEWMDKLERVNVIKRKLCFIRNFIFKLLLACPWVWSTLRLAGSEDWLQPQCLSCCVGADPMKQNSSQQGWSLPRPLWVCLCEANTVVLSWGLKQAIVCVVFEASWEGLWCKSKTLNTNSPELPIRSYKMVMICSCFCCACVRVGKSKLATTVPGQRHVSKMPMVPQHSPPPAGCSLGSATGRVLSGTRYGKQVLRESPGKGE